MSVFSYHLVWFITFFILTLISFLVTFFVLLNNVSIYFIFNLFSSTLIDLNVIFLFDYISISFITIVLLISSIVIVYSFNYIAPYSKSSYFLFLTVLFVGSIIVVILMPNLMYAILGWDGLGLVSFFLIVYYQNQSSIVSGLFTLLINRLGDSFFLCSLMMIFYYYPDFSFFSSSLIPLCLILFLILTFITNSALYPFSPWLPIAIAAPTPISALVHSSTLVTAGLYLMIRYHYVLHANLDFINLLIIISFFTSFYAGFNAIVEVDFNNLIALSTLSHLGFIGLAFSGGLLHLSFFHLLVHALFKSLLFITIGDIIVNLNHSQDSRYLSSGYLYTPFSCFIIIISLLNLLGIPSLSGFFSNDLVLETFLYSNISIIIEFILYLNIIFTYYYTYKLFYFSFSTNKLNPYQIFHFVSNLHLFLIVILSLFTLYFSHVFMSFIYEFILFYPLFFSIKFVPLCLNFIFFLYLLFFLVLPSVNSKFYISYFSSILFLSNLAITFSSNFYYNVLFFSVKSVEIGFVNYSLNIQVTNSFSFISNLVFLSLFNIQNGIIYFFIIIFIILFISFLI